MIGWVAGLVLKAGLTKSLPIARRVASIGLVVVGVIALGVAGCLLLEARDRRVLKTDALERKAATADRDLRGEREAGTVAGVAMDAFAASQAAVKEAQDEAVRNDPEGAARPVGPSVKSYFDRLRQEGRDAGGEAPR